LNRNNSYLTVPDEGFDAIDGVLASDTGLSSAETVQKVSELSGTASDLLGYIQRHKAFELPVYAQLSASAALNASLIQLLQLATPKDGVMPEPLEPGSAANTLLDIAFRHVWEHVPLVWDAVAELLEVPSAMSEGAFKATAFEHLASSGVSRALLFHYRQSMVWHVVKNLGPHQYCVTEGPVTVARSYLPPLVQRAADSLASHFGSIAQFVTAGTPSTKESAQAAEAVAHGCVFWKYEDSHMMSDVMI
jgi:hypothetical protein